LEYTLAYKIKPYIWGNSYSSELLHDITNLKQGFFTRLEQV
jgi:hypothetical protein